MKSWKKILSDPEAKKLKKYNKRVSKINELASKYDKMSVSQLEKELTKIRQSIKDGKKGLDDVLSDVFAITRAAAEKTIGERHFDVQLVGGMALHEGNVAEMRTGEGKTLTSTLPMVLNALSGKGTHLVTVNDYLVQRDAGWMGQIYNALGLSVAVIIPNASFIYDSEFYNEEHDDERFRHLKPCSRREAYGADITYGTNNEFGFDYLRDNISTTKVDELRQRPLHYAIVDEVDSILIDEARTPLIISAPASASGNNYGKFSGIVKKLKPADYELDEKRRAVSLNDEGTQKVQEWLKIDNLYSPENVHMIYHLEQALKAQTLFKRDKDYVVADDGEVVIVDEFTGRLMEGRRYSEGLHQAIEAKEGVNVQQESMTLATISFQNYFRLYEKLSGMTGTAETEADEFFEIYELGVVVVPTNKPIARKDLPDRIYSTEKGKFKAIVEEVKRLQEGGQPVLLGTASIEKNEQLSKMLKKAGIKHSVLNAKNNESEAAIVTGAGQKGAVTLATNIAGRGTDIKLGEGVVDLGGLFVLGAERSEARRIDNQLRGRSGRQGDLGASQFYISAEDELMRIFGGERLAGLMNKLGVDDETPIENKTISKSLENAQKKVESMNYDMRRNVVKYDDVMNRQRKSTYTARQEIIRSDDIKDRIETMISEEAQAMATLDGSTKNYESEIQTVIPFEDKLLSLVKKEKDIPTRASKLEDAAKKLYELKEEDFTSVKLREIEREMYLQILDTNWMQQLESLDHLRQGIGLRGIAQKDPVVEYRRESQILYDSMNSNVRSEVIRSLFNMQVPDVGVEGELSETEMTRLAKQSLETGSSKVPSAKGNKAKAGSRAQRRASVKSNGKILPAGAEHPNQPHRHLPDGSIELLDQSEVTTSNNSRVSLTTKVTTDSDQPKEVTAVESEVRTPGEEDTKVERKKQRAAAKKKKAKRKKGRR